jgi:hypothetical protein
MLPQQLSSSDFEEVPGEELFIYKKAPQFGVFAYRDLIAPGETFLAGVFPQGTDRLVALNHNSESKSGEFDRFWQHRFSVLHLSTISTVTE